MGIDAGMIMGVVVMRMVVMRVVVMGVVVMRVVVMRVVMAGMIIMRFATMIRRVMGVVVMVRIAMIMRLEAGPVTKTEPTDALDLQQTQPCRIGCQRAQRVGQPGRQFRPDPNHQIGPLQCRRLGGAQRMGMGRRGWRQHKIRHPHPRHHLGHQGMNRRDVDRNTRHIGQGRGGQNKR